MNRLSVSLALASVFAACHTDTPSNAPSASAPPNASAPQVQAAPRLELFDGHSLAGWDGDPRFWRVEDGCIVGQSSSAVPCDATTYLVRRGVELEDFELAFEFRIEGGNSGLQFRSEARASWGVAGFQADIEDGPNWTGCLYEQDGAGVVATRGESVELGVDGKRTTRFADASELLGHVRSREWNRYVVRARGARVELEINGHVTARVLDLRPERRLSGLLALQLHAGPPMKVAYRGFELKQLERGVLEPVAERTVAPAPPSAVRPSTEGASPHWLWPTAEAHDGDLALFARRFDVRAAAGRALLRGSADNHMRVFVNGELACTSDDWAEPVEVDVARLLREGENELALIARNDGGPAAVWLELEVDGEHGRLVRVVSDTSWSAQRAAPDTDFETWSPLSLERSRAAAPHSFGAFGVGPWGSPANTPAVASPAPESALAASELQLLPGFRAELVYSVPKGEQGSWVSLCEDPRGRLYVSDQYGALYRVTVGTPTAQTRVERLALELGSAHGLCWAYDSLYVVVSESDGARNGLYRVRDSDGDDVLDHSELLRAFDGGGEHGPHAVVLGPDGRLWIVGGNHTKLPEPIDRAFRPRNWGEDILLERIEDPNGHAVGIRAPGGWVVRTDENGKRWDLWACGFRNAYDLAFDDDGELFTFDSDMEWDIGTPWYQPTRIFHVVAGADFGWRGGPGKMPPDYPDTLPSVCDIGLSSPTGLVFGTEAKFPAKYRRALYALDWAYGTIYAVHLTPRGASFTGVAEKFASGKPFPVTDAVVARDGALYVTTGGRRAQSGLYRITWAGELPAGDRLAAERLGAEQVIFSGERERLASLMQRKIGPGPDDLRVDLLRREVGDPDRFVRHAARTRIEQLGAVEFWSTRKTKNERGDIERILSCIHEGGERARDYVVAELGKLQLSSYDNELLVQVARLHALALIRLEPDTDALERFRAAWERLYPSGSERVDRELLQLLVALGSPKVIAPALRTLSSAESQEERIWAAYCLRVAKVGWDRESRATFFRELDRLHASARGGYSLTKYIEKIREQAVDALSAEERAALAEVLAPPPSQARPATALTASFVHAWSKDELAPAFASEPRGRDFERGRAAFSKARCVECHRMGGEGGATGPDLTGVGSRYSRLDLLESLVEPSKTISDQYQDTEILTRGGDLVVGRIEHEDGAGLRLRRLPPQEDLLELAPSDIERRRLHPISRMPSGLLDVLTLDEILDLAAYVLAGGSPEAPYFTAR
ncbi:MAG: DUF1080 domain-containing protein [Planctomycetes bacterium]|nr:DUF1080 domain-containing protein [Planctomycetota bacterium]